MKLKLVAVAVAAALTAPLALAQGSGGTTTSPSVNQPMGRDTPAGQPAGSQVDPSTVGGASGMNRSGGAAAGASGTHHPMDKNRDGYISREEARDAEWNSRFSTLDTDRDGRISASEYGAGNLTPAWGITPSGAAAGASAIPSSPSSGGPQSIQGGPPQSPTTSKQPQGQN